MKKVGVVVLALFLMLPVMTVAQSAKGYMKVDALVGGVVSGTYSGWSEITGMDWSINSSYSTGGVGGINVLLPKFQISVTMPQDRASGQIALRQVRGQVIDSVKIDLVDINSSTGAIFVYQKITLLGVGFVENINKWSPADAKIPSVTVALAFMKIKVEHFIMNGNTRVKTGEWTYNVSTGGA